MRFLRDYVFPFVFITAILVSVITLLFRVFPPLQDEVAQAQVGGPYLTPSTVIWVSAYNSTDKAKRFSHYVCDGDADETEINNAITEASTRGGAVWLAAGDYYVETNQIVLKQKVMLLGEGCEATTIHPHASETLGADEALIWLDGDADGEGNMYGVEWKGGGIRDLCIRGDGTSTNSRPTGDATVSGIDVSGVWKLYEFHLQGVKIEYCANGWYAGYNENGDDPDATAPYQCKERGIFVDDNFFYFNDVAWFIAAHPRFGRNEFRNNDVAIGGRPYDCEFVGTWFHYNNRGVCNTLNSNGIDSTIITSCTFGVHNEVAVELGNNSIVTSCVFINTSAECDTGILVRPNADNQGIKDCKFYNQTGTGWTNGCIVFELQNGQSILFPSITGCIFRNPTGPCIAQEADNDNGDGTSHIYALQIVGNTFHTDYPHPLVDLAPGLYNATRGLMFSNNMIHINNDAVIGANESFVRIPRASLGCISVCGNVVVTGTEPVGGWASGTTIFDLDLEGGQFCSNMMYNYDNNCTIDGLVSASTKSSASMGAKIDNNNGIEYASGKQASNLLVTENSGTATITTSAPNTYVEVTHGLSFTPSAEHIQVTPQNQGSGVWFWISDVGATTFRINSSTAVSSDWDFSWRAKVF